MHTDLPYVDEHAVSISAPREQVWSALNRYIDSSLASGRHSLLTRVLGTEPASGFAVAEAVPAEQLTLVGRHRFSLYKLVFELEDNADDGTRLRALTYAAFPGVRGQAYRTLVIRTRLHVLATNHLLRAIARSGSGTAGSSGGHE